MRGRTFLLVAIASAVTLHCSSSFKPTGPKSDGTAGTAGTAGDAGSGGSTAASGGGTTGDAGGAEGGALTGGTSSAAGAGGSTDTTDTTVHGTLVNPCGGGYPGWRVLVNGEQVESDENGEFSVADVAETYDLVVAPSLNHVVAYLGLTTREPIVTVNAQADDPGVAEHSATMSGTLSDGYGFPSDGLYVLQATNSTFNGCKVVLPLPQGSGDPVKYSADWGPHSFSWIGALDAFSGYLSAVQLDDSGGNALGIVALDLLDGSTNPAVDVALTKLASHTVAATATLPDGVTFTNVRIVDSGELDTNNPGSLVVPIGVDLAPPTQIRATGMAGTSTTMTTVVIEETQDAVSLPLTVPIDVTSPDDNQAGVDTDTLFSWTDYPNGVQHLYISDSNAFRIDVYTDGTSFKLSDLGIYDLTLAAGVEHSWDVGFSGPATSVDALVDGTNHLLTDGIAYSGSTEARTFTP